ncbi:hydroxyacid dehydrogenase [Streptomyces sp. A7024]|uniref:Hydroxyacid dehydrogenase n=2 Tax=Streptomyces coryli TaxID=1128680 RepID=A0A6G4U9S6_9ACTN|nr:hydroxyacid dehydrogenase [Streptomyces coryli]NGN68995.1 hydroxyacid dehydrogenase [Streptomyces coryli]
MSAEEADIVLPGEVRDRVAKLTQLLPDPLSGDLTGRLAGIDLLVTCWSCPPLTEQVLAGAGRLRAVIHAAGSVKQLATEAVWRRGIAVSSAADANAGPVVDFTLAAITFAGKQVLPAARDYVGRRQPLALREGLDDRTIGIIGASRIGRGVLTRLAASGRRHRVLVYDPYLPAAEAIALGAEPVELDVLCRESSIVSVHAPELPETRHLLDARRLALIPDGGTVINTARGSLLDTEALTHECATGRLNAYLDVTDPEPLPPDHPLYALPNVLVTPHVAGVQGSELRRLGEYAAAEVERFVRGEGLLGAVTEAELPRLA